MRVHVRVRARTRRWVGEEANIGVLIKCLWRCVSPHAGGAFWVPSGCTHATRAFGVL